MRKLEVCKTLERDDFKRRVREIHLSNQLILGFTLALDDSLVLVFFQTSISLADDSFSLGKFACFLSYPHLIVV